MVHHPKHQLCTKAPPQGHMKHILTHHASKDQLNYLVARHNRVTIKDVVWCYYAPCDFWQQGGPILEYEQISVSYNKDKNKWQASKGPSGLVSEGETLLEAAMRCLVCFYFGGFAEVPEELLDV